MTEKWADFLISKVQYNAAETHIVKVLLHEDLGDVISRGTEETRGTVVAHLDGGRTVMTIYRGAEGKWTRGAEVRVVNIGGEKFIRTDRDATKKDNLGNLPRF